MDSKSITGILARGDRGRCDKHTGRGGKVITESEIGGGGYKSRILAATRSWKKQASDFPP